MAALSDLRQSFHESLAESVYGGRVRQGETVQSTVHGKTFPVYTNADSHNDASVVFAAGVGERLDIPPEARPGVGGSTIGAAFERATREFVTGALDQLSHLRTLTTLKGQAISHFTQYLHLDDVERIVEQVPELEAALGGDYVVTPDIVVVMHPYTPDRINDNGDVLGEDAAPFSPIRSDVGASAILHASISCKWSMRRDRAQNTRTEALNLVRNRKGRLPHVVAVTMECAPDILGSLSLGTGDIDCVYHGALPELLEAGDAAAESFGGPWESYAARLHMMVQGSRLRDLTDLPLDLLA